MKPFYSISRAKSEKVGQESLPEDTAINKKKKPRLNMTRQKIIDVATKLFYRKGVKAITIDKIAAKAGITKMTFYKYFASKEDLILAVLQNNVKNWWQWLEAEIKQR